MKIWNGTQSSPPYEGGVVGFAAGVVLSAQPKFNLDIQMSTRIS